MLKKNVNNKEVPNQLQRLKSKSMKIYHSAKQQITQHQKIYKQLSQSKSKQIKSPSSKVFNQRQYQIQKLTKNLNQKINYDHKARIRYMLQEQTQIQRKAELVKKIQQINHRNQLRIKEIQEIEQNFIRKIANEYKKDQQIQKRLKNEFQKLRQSQKKIEALKEAQLLIEHQNWNSITNEKKKLEKMVDNLNKNSEKIIRQKSLELLKQKEPINEINNEVKNVISSKNNKINTQNSKVNTIVIEQDYSQKQHQIKGDAKQIGKRYLQHAKKIPILRQKPKVKLLNINIKNIDYAPDILNLLARKTGDLSKINNNSIINNNIEQQIEKIVQPHQENNSIQQQQINHFQKNAEQIQSFIKKVKGNIEEIQANDKQ